MGASNVGLSIDIPKRLRVIAGEVEVDGIRPRSRVVRILGLEDDLQSKSVPGAREGLFLVHYPIWKNPTAAGHHRPEW